MSGSIETFKKDEIVYWHLNMVSFLSMKNLLAYTQRAKSGFKLSCFCAAFQSLNLRDFLPPEEGMYGVSLSNFQTPTLVTATRMHWNLETIIFRLHIPILELRGAWPSNVRSLMMVYLTGSVWQSVLIFMFIVHFFLSFTK